MSVNLIISHLFLFNCAGPPLESKFGGGGGGICPRYLTLATSGPNFSERGRNICLPCLTLAFLNYFAWGRGVGRYSPKSTRYVRPWFIMTKLILSNVHIYWSNS